MIEVELEALEIFGRHGVTEEERARGQTFLYDVGFEVSDAALSDRLVARGARGSGCRRDRRTLPR
ncbi:MAG: hypothetical protein JF623_08410 [Acidobacteria bacterium]|nr:hypothetical protein [Acidobacteriota bacterium]